MRIAHFSDAHALSLEGVRPWQFLNKRFAGWVNLRVNRRDKHPVRLFEALVEDLNVEPPDEVIVTGDLTNLSLSSEFALARRLLDRIALGPEHVTVVPGNHDVYTIGAWLARPFWKNLSPYAQGDASEVSFPSVRIRKEVAIVSISTALPSPVPFADGWLGATQLALLEAALQRLQGKFRVLAMHHPPFTNRHSALRGLRDRGALQKLLARVGCELVLHGHEHRDERHELRGPKGAIPVIGVGSCTYDDSRSERRARYNVYEIVDGRLKNVSIRVHDACRNRFV